MNRLLAWDTFTPFALTFKVVDVTLYGYTIESSIGPFFAKVDLMLTILGQQSKYCDGISRRGFLQIGSLGLGGASLAQLLRAEQSRGIQTSHKSVIMILLPGGPPQLDMFDMKPNAPVEIRGEFKPIRSNVSGIEITELMPRTAALMDKFVIVRSLHGGRDDHNLHQCLTGWETHEQQGDSQAFGQVPQGGWPSIGAAVSKIQGSVSPAVPAFVSLSPKNAESTTRASLGQPGFLGIGHAGFEPNRRRRTDVVYKSGVEGEALRKEQESSADIVLQDISLNRLADRQQLHRSIDKLRRDLDSSGVMNGMDAVQSQAFGILTSSKLGAALDWRREDHSLRREYGISDSEIPVNGGPELLKQFLVARRLVEAGVRCVTLAFSPWPLERESRGGHNWDWHQGNFTKARFTLPMLDMGLSALVRDMDNRGMLDDVSIVVWGEFGRSPRINRNAGRDHWPQAASALLAGGGLRSGQVIGSTDGHASEPKDRPVHYREVFATLYHTLGIPPSSLVLQDLDGRPHQIVGGAKPIGEII